MKWTRQKDAVHVGKGRRAVMAEEAVAGARRNGLVFHQTGNALVLAFADRETGVVEVYDCRVRRKAVVR